DPIGTGFSRTLDNDKSDNKSEGKENPQIKKKKNTDYFEVKRDLESLCEFIQKFLSKFERWSTPVFIAGESYGGFRVAKLSRKLQEDFGVSLNGAILISPALELSQLVYSD